VAVAGAVDDRLLLRAARRDQAIEEVVGHGADAVGEDKTVFERLGAVVLASLGGSQLLARDRVPQRQGADVVAVQAGLALGERAALQEDVPPHDLAGGEIAVVDALA
jgi:hypothetical protein